MMIGIILQIVQVIDSYVQIVQLNDSGMVL
jgi:hypothetical protein